MGTIRITKKWLLLFLFVVFAAGLAIEFNRRFHFWFDAHHVHESATAWHWCLGWFRDWDEGPLHLVISERPIVERRQGLSRRNFSRLIRRIDGESEVLFHSADYQGITLALGWLPAKEQVLVYGNLSTEFRSFHESNDWADSIEGETIETSSRTWEWIAWKPLSGWQFSRGMQRRSLGETFTIPHGGDPGDWAFIINSARRSESGSDQFQSEVWIGYDPLKREWRLYDREYREEKGINSWLESRSP